jgi:hypothetical protein
MAAARDGHYWWRLKTVVGSLFAPSFKKIGSHLPATLRTKKQLQGQWSTSNASLQTPLHYSTQVGTYIRCLTVLIVTLWQYHVSVILTLLENSGDRDICLIILSFNRSLSIRVEYLL